MLQGLTAPQRTALGGKCEWLEIPADRAIFEHRQKGRHVYFLIAGRAAVYVERRPGEPVEFGRLAPGQMFGDLSVIDDGPQPVSVRSIEPCRVARLDQRTFLDLLKADASVMLAVMRHLAASVRTLQMRWIELGTVDEAGRLVAELQRLAFEGDIHGDTSLVRDMPDRGEVARRIASSREVVLRHLKRLQHQGVIEIDGRELRIVSLERLDALVRVARGESETAADTKQRSRAAPRKAPRRR